MLTRLFNHHSARLFGENRLVYKETAAHPEPPAAAARSELTHPPEKGKIGTFLDERLNAIGGGLADMTYRNIFARVKDTWGAVKNVVGGIIGEPLKGLGEAVQEMSNLSPLKAIMKIALGVRNGIQRVYEGGMQAVRIPFAAAGQFLEGLARTALGTAMIGDLKKFTGETTGTPSVTH